MLTIDDSLVTIILTTLNSERFVARSIESCLQQTHSNLELLIVDGGSTDHTLEIVAGYNDTRIRVIHQRGNAGKLPGALNLGMAYARGDLITWTQDDSWFGPQAIETMFQYLATHTKVGLVYSDYWFVDESGQPFRYQLAGEPEQISDGGDIIGQCFLFRRQVYDSIGPQNERYYPVHEIPWRVRLARSFVIQPLHEALLYYTLHPASLTGRIGAWQLRYMVADALLEDKIWDKQQHRQKVAQIHVDHAYDEFVLQGHYGRFWSHLFHAARLKPQTLNNRGTWKLMLASLLPSRETYRQNTLSQWKTTHAQQQRKLQEGVHV